MGELLFDGGAPRCFVKGAIEMQEQRIETPYGPMLARWSKHGLYACNFDQQIRPNGDELKASPAQRQLANAFDAYFTEGRFLWNLESLDWSDVPEFHQAVLRECYRIPAGTTCSYGALAVRVGSPGAARAVGSAMARNRWPILIPCHRVVGASGSLTGYSGKGGLKTKRQLLDHEIPHSLLALTTR